MSRSHLIQRAIVGMALVLFVGGGFATATTYWIQKSDYAIILDDQRVPLVDFQRRLVETRQMFLESKLPEAVLQQSAVNALIERQLLLREAQKRGIQADSSEVEQEWQRLLGETYGGNAERMRQDLYRSYYTESDFRQELQERLMMRKLGNQLEAGAKIPDARLQEYYKAHLDQFRRPEKIEARHILFKADEHKPVDIAKAKTQALDVIAQLQGGADFVSLAKKYSQDESSKIDGGQLSAFAKGEMVPAFEAAAWKLKPGEFTSTPVQSNFGWHVILRGKTQPGGVKSFAEAKPELTAQLLESQKREFMQQWIKRQRQASKIEIHPSLIKSVNPTPPGQPPVPQQSLSSKP